MSVFFIDHSLSVLNYKIELYIFLDFYKMTQSNNVWMLRQNFYGDTSKGIKQSVVENYIKKTRTITCPFGHIDKDENNTQYVRFMNHNLMKKNDIVLIPLKGTKTYIKVELEQDLPIEYFDTGFYYHSNNFSINLSLQGITKFKPHVRKVINISKHFCNFDMRKFPKNTFCKLTPHLYNFILQNSN